MDCFPSVLLSLARLARAQDVGTPKPRDDWASTRLTKEPRAGPAAVRHSAAGQIDHIRNSDRKSIVAARCRAAPGEAFQPLDGPATRALHGAYLVRVPTLLPVRDQRWFLDRIRECEQRRLELLGPLLA